LSLEDAVATAKRFVTVAIKRAPSLGHGQGPLNHNIAVEFTPTHVFINGE
jgi:hydroxymethylpyrimidine/phosphomethylpyrimidine kinase